VAAKGDATGKNQAYLAWLKHQKGALEDVHLSAYKLRQEISDENMNASQKISRDFARTRQAAETYTGHAEASYSQKTEARYVGSR